MTSTESPASPEAPQADGAGGPAVVYARTGAVGTLTLARPNNRNAMTPELLDAFAGAAAEAIADREARCVVITGSGSCFSAGADLRAGLQRAEGDGALPHERSYAMYEPFLSVLDIEVPVIGALNGHAVGGGFGLALICDVRVCSDRGKYGANFARLGVAPGMAISYLLPRIVGMSAAYEMLLAGELISGERAVRLGLCSDCVPADGVLDRSLELAERMASNGPYAVRETKRAIRRGLGLDVRAAAAREAFIQAVSLAREDAAEGVAAQLEKRPPQFRDR